MVQKAANTLSDEEATASGRNAISFEGVDRCPICNHHESEPEIENAEDYLYFIPGKFNYRRCLNCTVVFEDPRPAEKDLARCYVDYHTHEAQSLPESFLGEWHGASRWIRGGVLARKYGYSHLAGSGLQTLLACALDMVPPVRKPARCYLEKSLPRFTGEGRALEVGIGNGQYAAMLKRLGWQVEGVELDPTAAANTSRRYKIPVSVGTLEAARFPAGSFDFLSMFHVIEHLPDPIATLRECRRILRPGSRIMLRTPNFDSNTRRAFGKFWRGLEAPRHLVVFNPNSLEQALATAGFSVARITTIPTATRHYVESSLAIAAANENPVIPRGSVGRLTRLYNLQANIARISGKLAGDELHVEAIC